LTFEHQNFALLVTLVQRDGLHDSTKLEVSTAFLFRRNQRHGTDGQTDRRTDGCNSQCGPLGGPRNKANVKVTGHVFCARLCENWIVLHQINTGMLFGPFYTYRQIRFTSENT